MTDDSQQAEADMLKWAKAYAHKQGWSLNPDEKQTGTVIKGLVRNKNKFGRPYCPCRLRSGDEEKDRNIECPSGSDQILIVPSSLPETSISPSGEMAGRLA